VRDGRIHEVASSVLPKNGSAKASNWLDICSGHLGWISGKETARISGRDLLRKSDICPELLKDNENLKHIFALKKPSQLLHEAPVLP
jgi:hypothetical protein